MLRRRTLPDHRGCDLIDKPFSDAMIPQMFEINENSALEPVSAPDAGPNLDKTVLANAAVFENVSSILDGRIIFRSLVSQKGFSPDGIATGITFVAPSQATTRPASETCIMFRAQSQDDETSFARRMIPRLAYKIPPKCARDSGRPRHRYFRMHVPSHATTQRRLTRSRCDRTALVPS